MTRRHGHEYSSSGADTTAEESLSKFIGKKRKASRNHQEPAFPLLSPSDHEDFEFFGSEVPTSCSDGDESGEDSRPPVRSSKSSSQKHRRIFKDKSKRFGSDKRRSSARGTSVSLRTHIKTYAIKTYAIWTFETLRPLNFFGLSGWALLLASLSLLSLMVWIFPLVQSCWAIITWGFGVLSWVLRIPKTLITSICGIPGVSLIAACTSYSNRPVRQSHAFYLCQLSGASLVMNCNTLYPTPASVTHVGRVLDHPSDSIKELSKSPEEFFEASKLLAEFRRDLAPLSVGSPYGTTHLLIKEVNQVIVALRRYDADHDSLLRSVNRTSTALVTSYAKLPKRRWYSPWVDLIRDSPLVMFQRNVAFAFQEWATSLGDLRRKLEILIKPCDVMHEQTKVLNIEATEGLGSENEQQGFWMYQFNIPLTSEQSASANLIRKYKNILKVIDKASPLLVTAKGNVDPALAAIGSAHDRATADLLGVFSPRGATSVDIRLEAVLEDLKITMRDARVARIHRAEIRASIESGS